MEEEYIEIGNLNTEHIKNYQLQTNRLIITNERIEHINKRHNNDFDKYKNYIEDIIQFPDYVLEDISNQDTVLYLKTFENLNLQIVIKLQIEKEKNKCNTIITFWNMRKRSYNQIISKIKIIFKNLDKNE